MRAAARLILAAAALAAAAPTASAAPLSLQVVNGRGVGQASLVSVSGAACPAGCSALTDGYGRLALDVAAGDRVAATRGSLAPEGAGVQLVVPDPVPATPVTITLPTVLDAVSPALDGSERWLLDRVNEERAALGRGPLQESGTLNRAADAYARYLLSTNQFSHTALADPSVRAIDQGWPSVGGVGETLALAPSKEYALALWRTSPPHWDLLMLDGLSAAGVGRVGDRWVMSAGACPAAAAERCELGASGEPATPPPVAGGGGGTAERRAQAEQRTRLRVRMRRAGRRLRVSVRVVEGRGRVHVAVRQGQRRARVRGRRAGSLYRAVARLPRSGRWRVLVRFEGTHGWPSKRLRARTVKVR